MTDTSESSRRRPTSAASHLQYPTLPPLSAPVEEWLSRSRPSSMTSDRLPDHPLKTLSESWATLSVSDLHSEDGSRSEQTDVGSLIDQTSPDDVASLDGRYSSSDADPQDYGGADLNDAGDDIQSSISGSQELPTLYAQGGSPIDDSNLTTKPALPHSLDSIEFVEPEKWPEIQERVELKHTIRVFEGAAASELKSRLPYNPTDAILMATVQQTMIKQSLDLDKPFRVLYIGHSGFRNIILDKIGDVLVSSSCPTSDTSSAESSRYHVVPTSFGAGAVPNFAELLPIHVQLVVDECLEATAGLQENQPSTVNLRFKNRPPCTSSWTGSEYSVSSTTEWTLPDVAILFVSSSDDMAAVKTRRLAHSFLERHGIPAMVISEEEPLWKFPSEIIALNHNSLHMCLESRLPRAGKTVVLRRYPIDLKTFESITPGQLNRNLASLVSLYPKKTHKATSDTPKTLDHYSIFDLEKYPGNWIPHSYTTRARELAPMLRLVTLTLISAIALSIGYAAVKTMVLFLAQWVAGSTATNSFSLATNYNTPTAVVTLDQLKQTSLAVRPPGDVPSLRIHSSNEATGLTIPVSNSPARTNAFEIQVVGDCHVVIKPPHSFTSSKKQPRFNVSVHRHNQVLPYELSQIFDGVYSLKLAREDAYSVVNVTIVAKSKSLLNQTTAVDFGTPWLKIESWRRAAQDVSSHLVQDWHMAQTGLTEVYGRFSTDLQVLVGDVVKRSHFLRQDAERLRREGMHVRDTVLSRSKQLSEVFSQTAVQRFRSVSSELQRRSVRVNREAKVLASDVWNRLGESAAKVDLRAVMDRVRNVSKCAALDRAQTRARYFVGRGG
ncbi:hypothetical protein N7474_000945 [Penicillium riverlandense]|uniref:uncharacterized protein n=1 Tax=Penicillium riverlandense TaxID=1903569 RepID=UPI002546CA83|nr:uncharacterized protein N7474_000945 [Penicillium riverlandense]KAJ5832634.1 hypothetical protein N7474_000945 [Penicillium riverlandense]